MQIPPERAWMARLERATRLDGPTAPPGTNDAGLVGAADDIFAKAKDLAKGFGVSPAEVGERLWSSRGRDGIPGLADRIVSEGANAEAVKQIASASMSELSELIDALAVHMLVREGKENELHLLLDLKIVADSGSRLVQEYNRRIKSSLSHKRPPAPVDPQIERALKAIADRITHRYFDDVGDKITEKARDGAVEASKRLWKAGRGIAGRLYETAKVESKVATNVKDAVAKLKATVASAMPEALVENLRLAKEGATSVVDAVTNIHEVKDDREVAARFLAALPAISETLDPKADAVGLGLVEEMDALFVTGASGHEVMYVRETGELAINELAAVGGRIGIGGTMRAFTRNAYGDVAGASEERRRAGYELGAICVHLGAYGGREKDEPRGWHSTFSLGVNFSVPLLSDQSVFSVKEKRVRTVKLLPSEIARIEEKLANPSQAASAWHTKMREATS